MATFTTTVTKHKIPRMGTGDQVVGSVFSKSVKLSIPASVGANDTSVMTDFKIPAGALIVDVFTKGSANGAANSGITLTTTTDNLVVFGAANANNVADTWTVQTLNAANRVSTVDQTLTLGCSGANAVAAGAWTLDMVLVYAAVGNAAGTFSTFTV